jgi:hypothetical protein
MKMLRALGGLSFTITFAFICEIQACFTSAFQEVWNSYAHRELDEEYALY